MIENETLSCDVKPNVKLVYLLAPLLRVIW